jgi:hypothetical protein
MKPHIADKLKDNPDTLSKTKLIALNCLTKYDIPPERVLEAATGKLEGVIVMGFEKDGTTPYLASSYADGGTILWLMELIKKRLFE